MASPDPNAYRQADYPPPPPPPQFNYHPYSDRQSVHYTPEQTPPPLPPPVQQYHPLPPTEMEQPLDLSVSRSPRPSSAGSLDERPKRSRLEGGGRPGHPGVCLEKGCGCQNSMPMHHPASYSRGHRHSPYSPFAPGTRSPTIPQYGYPSSSPAPSPAAMMEGGSNASSSSSSSLSSAPNSSSSYMADRRSPYRAGPLMPVPLPYSQSAGPMLAPPTASSAPSLSPRPRDHSPRQVSPRGGLYRPFEDSSGPGLRSSSLPDKMDRYHHTSQEELEASSSLLVLSNTTTSSSHTTGSSSSSSAPQQPGDDRHPFPQHHHHAWRDYRAEERERHQQQRMEEDEADSKPSQSDEGRGFRYGHHPGPLHPSPLSHHHHHSSWAHYSQAMSVVHDENSGAAMDTALPVSNNNNNNNTNTGTTTTSSPAQSQGEGGRLGLPTQDRCVASSNAEHSDLTASSSTSSSSSSPSSGPAPPAQPRGGFLRVVGTTELSKVRAQRDHEVRSRREKMKTLVSLRKDKNPAAKAGQQNQPQKQQQQPPRPAHTDGNDSEGGSEQSSAQASPRSSDGSEVDVAQGFPVPPDPNLKISPLDYLLSEYLVQQRDVPFKPCNTEIREIYTGVRKGPLTLVDLIELQVEASLKA